MLARNLALVLFGSFWIAACGTDEPSDDTQMETDEPSPTNTGSPTSQPSETTTPTTSEPSETTTPPDEPPAEATYGAVSAELLPGCAVDAHVFNFPDVATAPVSADAKGEYWVDEEVVDDNEISVNCEWVGATPNRVSITIGDQLSLAPRALGMSFRATLDEPGTGSLWLMDTERGVQYGTEQGGEQCEFTLFEIDATTGSIWGQFSCPRLIPDAGEADACELGPSFFYMTNCDIL